MSTYYRVIDGAFRELTPEQYAALALNKRADLRVFIVDAQPVPTSQQVVVNGGIVVGPVEAHQTYTLRDKTAEELEADSLKDEKAQLDSWLTDIQTLLAIDNATFNAMSNADKFNTLRDTMRVTLKAAKRYVRQEKRAL